MKLIEGEQLPAPSATGQISRAKKSGLMDVLILIGFSLAMSVQALPGQPVVGSLRHLRVVWRA